MANDGRSNNSYDGTQFALECTRAEISRPGRVQRGLELAGPRDELAIGRPGDSERKQYHLGIHQLRPPLRERRRRACSPLVVAEPEQRNARDAPAARRSQPAISRCALTVGVRLRAIVRYLRGVGYTTVTAERGPPHSQRARQSTRLVFIANADDLSIASSSHVLDDIEEVRFGRGTRSVERCVVDGVRALVLRVPDDRMSSTHMGR